MNETLERESIKLKWSKLILIPTSSWIQEKVQFKYQESRLVNEQNNQLVQVFNVQLQTFNVVEQKKKSLNKKKVEVFNVRNFMKHSIEIIVDR